MKPPSLSEIEEVLTAASIKAIEDFAMSHRGESFYGFGLDCNAEYGGVLLCLNTEEEFQTTAAEYSAKWSYTEERLSDLRKSFGDWKYHGFNLEMPWWDEMWGPYEKSIARYWTAYVHEFEEGEDSSDEAREAFAGELMDSLCRVLIRIEESGVLGQLNRDDNFFTHVEDHDEPHGEADERLRLVRAQSQNEPSGRAPRGT
jgi:hypothetical protein